MVDAGGLNPPGAKALYRFESDPGHINFLALGTQSDYLGSIPKFGDVVNYLNA